jgi:hypothetical protein
MDQLESLRHDAIRVLSGAVASDRLSVEQFESRLALVHQAPNRATLDAIVADVLPSGGYPVPTGLVGALPRHPALAPVEPAELLRVRTVLSSSKRAGSWTVPLRLEAKVVLGELTIDLRDAVFCSDVLDVELEILLGSFTLIVPAGAQVENECEERWSSTTHSTRSTRGANPIGLLIRLTGRVRWSNVEIKEKRRSDEEPISPWKRLLGGEQ